MTCPICGNKPMNCDCTEGDKKANDLEDELASLREENERLKKELGDANQALIQTGFNMMLCKGLENEAAERGAREIIDMFVLRPDISESVASTARECMIREWRESRKEEKK
jgi:hypothetical protein